MADYFSDSSALVKRYVSEVGSVWLRTLLNSPSTSDVSIVAMTRVEIVAALARRVRGGTISPADASAAIAALRKDLLTNFLIIQITDALLDDAMQLAEKHGLRGYDAVQLAAGCAVNAMQTGAGLPPITFLSADNELNRAVMAEGLSVDNPNVHP